MVPNFFDDIGQMDCIERVHKILYNKFLDHEWLKEFSSDWNAKCWKINKPTSWLICLVVSRRYFAAAYPCAPISIFLLRKRYSFFITEEIFMIRHDLLGEALNEANVSADHKQRWLKYDLGMKGAIVKKASTTVRGSIVRKKSSSWQNRALNPPPTPPP